MRRIISVLLENEPGALSRVVGLFAQRNYNIETLTVAPTEDPTLSRLTVTTRGSDKVIEQITKQLNKLINVIKITELHPDHAVERELLIATVRAPADTRGQVIQLVDVFGGRILDVGHDDLTVSVDDEPARVDDFEELLRPYGIVELQRTGRVALPKIERPARLRGVRRAS